MVGHVIDRIFRYLFFQQMVMSRLKIQFGVMKKPIGIQNARQHERSKLETLSERVHNHFDKSTSISYWH